MYTKEEEELILKHGYPPTYDDREEYEMEILAKPPDLKISVDVECPYCKRVFKIASIEKVEVKK